MDLLEPAIVEEVLLLLCCENWDYNHFVKLIKMSGVYLDR